MASTSPCHTGTVGCILETSGIMVLGQNKQVVVSRNRCHQLFGDSADLLSLEQETLHLQEKLDNQTLNRHAAKD